MTYVPVASVRRRAGVGRWARLAVLAGAVVGLAVLSVGTANAVANGEPVREGTYRFAVRLEMPDITRPDGTHYSSACSASLISPQWIVGAGHCFHDGARNRVSGAVRYRVIATIGTADVGSGRGIVVDVVEAQQAPNADLAVAKLTRPVRGITPIRIAKQAPAVGSTLHIAGWGWTATGPVAPSKILHTGRFTVSRVTGNTIGVVGRSPKPDTSACAYDSGAPYFYLKSGHAYLTSVESDGPDCPHSQEETAARADNIRDWILRTIR